MENTLASPESASATVLNLRRRLDASWISTCWEEVAGYIIEDSADPQKSAHYVIIALCKKISNPNDPDPLGEVGHIRSRGFATRLGLCYGVPDTVHGEWLISARLQNSYVLHPDFDSMTQKFANRNPSDAEVLILAKRFCGPNHRDKNDESTGENMRSLREFVQKYGSKDTVRAVEQMLLDMKPKPVYYNHGNWGL